MTFLIYKHYFASIREHQNKQRKKLSKLQHYTRDGGRKKERNTIHICYTTVSLKITNHYANRQRVQDFLLTMVISGNHVSLFCVVSEILL